MNQHNDEQDLGFWSKNTWIQIGYGMWANQVVIHIGMSYGFSSVAIPQLTDASAIFRVTMDELGWIVSVLTLTAPIGCLISGFLVDRIGRRLVLVICQLPTAFGWIYTGAATCAGDMIVGRFISGIGLGMSAGPPRTYCTEISLPVARGVTGVIPTFSMALGVTIQATLGSLFEWRFLCYICGMYSALLIILNMFLPESPYFVLMSGDMDKTRKVLQKFRTKNYDTAGELEEMGEFRRINNLCKLPIKESFKMLFKAYSCKPFSIIMIYIIASQLSGTTIMMFWTVEILEASKVSIDPYIGNILLGVTRVFAGLGTSLLMFFVARRPLALSSALGVGFVCILLGIYIKVNTQLSFLPELGYMAYLMFASLGYYSLPLLMLFEMIPLQVRGMLGGITVSLNFVAVSMANKSFPGIYHAVGMANTLFLFGVSSLAASTFLFFFLPETKYLTLQEIEEFYRGKRPTLRSSMSIHPISPELLRRASSIRFRTPSIIPRSGSRDKTERQEQIKRSESFDKTEREERIKRSESADKSEVQERRKRTESADKTKGQERIKRSESADKIEGQERIQRSKSSDDTEEQEQIKILETEGHERVRIRTDSSDKTNEKMEKKKPEEK